MTASLWLQAHAFPIPNSAKYLSDGGSPCQRRSSGDSRLLAEFSLPTLAVPYAGIDLEDVVPAGSPCRYSTCHGGISRKRCIAVAQSRSCQKRVVGQHASATRGRTCAVHFELPREVERPTSANAGG